MIDRSISCHGVCRNHVLHQDLHRELMAIISEATGHTIQGCNKSNVSTVKKHNAWQEAQRLHGVLRKQMQDTLCLTPRLHWKVTLCLVTSNGKGHGTGKLKEEFSIETSHSWWKPASPKVQQADSLGNMGVRPLCNVLRHRHRQMQHLKFCRGCISMQDT